MAYTVLARRYRSQRFDDVVGQDAVAQTLKNAISSGRVAHAYLFTGTRGVGKTTMARILAKSLNCLASEGPTAKPCLKCDSCVAVNAGDDIDVIEIDGASNTGVDNIRQLRQNAIYRPARARYKIYIIDEVHMLSTGAFNALLKILEEPPDHVKFIFATTEPNKVLPTIQSRCQRFDFNAISPDLIAGQLRNILKDENIKYEDDLLLQLARLANGSMRDALSLLDQMISTGVEILTAELLEQYLGLPNRQKIYRLVRAIGSSDTANVLAENDALLKAGFSAVQVIDAAIDCMRDVMVTNCAGQKENLLLLTSQEKKEISSLAEMFGPAALVYNITVLERMRWTIKNSDNPRPVLEAAVLRLAMSEHFMDLSGVLSQPDTAERPKTDVKKKSISDDRQPSAGLNSSSGPSLFFTGPVAGRSGGQVCPAAPGLSSPKQERPEAAAIVDTGGGIELTGDIETTDGTDSVADIDPVAGIDSIADVNSIGAELMSDTAGERLFPDVTEVEGLKLRWLAVLEAIRVSEPSTAAYLSLGVPVSWGSGRLILGFAKSSELAKQMCQKRLEVIGKGLGDILGSEVAVEFATVSAEQNPPLKAGTAPSRVSQKEIEVVKQDPAIQSLLRGMDARILDVQRVEQA